MRTHLPALLALALSLCSSGQASEPHPLSTPLPGPLGRFWGIGYGPGYHAQYPSRPQREHRMRAFLAPAPHPQHFSGLQYAPVIVSDMPASAAPASNYLHGEPTLAAPLNAAPLNAAPQNVAPPAAAPMAAPPSARIQQPPRDQPPKTTQDAPSDKRASFLMRLPNLRGAAGDAAELPSPTSPVSPISPATPVAPANPAKKGSVAQWWAPQAEAR